MSDNVLRLMGESDVHYVAVQSDKAREVISDFETLEDKTNWLGHMMDAERFASISEADLAKVESIAEELFAEKQADLSGNFIMMVILREKWPVGSKAKFKLKADRVEANHTYKLVFCPAQMVSDLNDTKALEQAELQALGAQVPVFKKAKKLFANSSAIHGFLKQANS